MYTSVHICTRMYIFTYIAAQFVLVGRQEMSITHHMGNEQLLPEDVCFSVAVCCSVMHCVEVC